MLHKKALSVRVPEGLRRTLKRTIVRLTLNPGLYARTKTIVRWTRKSTGKLSAAEVISQARRLYPNLSWSDSVENYLVDLIEQNVRHRGALSMEEKKLIQRFASLSSIEKIRFMQRKIRLFRYLKNLTTSQ